MNTAPLVPPETLRVVVATPLTEELCLLIERAEPRIELVRDQALLPPMRRPADYRGDPAFRRTVEQQADFERMLDSADVLFGIPDVNPVALRRTVEANPGLRWVQVMAAGGGSQVKSAGLGQADLDRVVFTTSAGVHGGPLAEFAIFGIMAGAKQLPVLQRDQRTHAWPERRALGQVRDQTVLVIGLGGVGREVARLAKGLGMRVIGTSRDDRPVPFVDELISTDDLAAGAARADAIVVALPGTAATLKLVGENVFGAVRPGTTFVSIGRGTVVDEDALIRALESGRIGFAALDVFAKEPLDTASALWDFPNVVISPHTAALDADEERRIAELFADNATRFLDGLPLRNVVNTVEFY
ncbi:D-2-hydroxyacid dehydrogenase [Cryobacterium sp. RTS3]|uniref:D-2-hydroxyacid dehydrogenase n=1 Tax=Cryobacterium sp. RTS3 TaxID=3048643 RepID=UPI002B223CB3|nr:D-2-hydroxyacid dehydrogenase [Cryobacterium sp. RTS3]MEB0000024.1 D-2-hydroxyacid dehydrogenase [Cryobacterium sp. RTS3]